jgi:epoxyqueuosine reductase
MDVEGRIREKALELGYEDCGVVKVKALAGYREKLEERMRRIARGEEIYGRLRGYADPSAAYPAIKSIVVAIIPNYKYRVPREFDGVYGKAYMFDSRTDQEAPFFQIRKRLVSFLESLGLSCTLGDRQGIPAPARWAAYQAGLGTIRKNNFFYTENGSHNRIEMIGVDRELELVREAALKECPDGCARCMEACPTRTLSSPYTMSMAGCVSFQTNVAANLGMGIPSPEMAGQIGGWLYGCDACQDACPFNKGKSAGHEDFPRLEELAPSMRPENIMQMGYDEIGRTLGLKYWYIMAENHWKWKINALTTMMNGYTEKYEAAIRLGLEDENEKVRSYARGVCEKLGMSC